MVGFPSSVLKQRGIVALLVVGSGAVGTVYWVHRIQAQERHVRPTQQTHCPDKNIVTTIERLPAEYAEGRPS